MTKRAVRDLRPSDILSRREIDEICLRPKSLRDRALLALLYLTGGRISEVLDLQKDNFRIGESEGVKYLVIENMQVEKWRSYMVRNVPIPWSDRLRPTITEYLAELADQDKLFPFSRQWAYEIVKKNEPESWPHWYRSQRISYLMNEKKPRMAIEDMQEFLKIKDIRTLNAYRHTAWTLYAQKLVEPEVRT